MLNSLIKWYLKYSQQPSVTPSDEGYSNFECKSSDGVTIRGWSFVRKDMPLGGTLIWLHGFGGSASFCAPEWLYHIRTRLEREINRSFASVSFDFRGHGQSDYKTPALGIPESWDCQAVLDLLDSFDFPKPYILIGESMGAMVAPHVARTDSRVRGCVCLMAPSAPLEAMMTISKNYARFLAPYLRRAGEVEYGSDVLLQGDMGFFDLESTAGNARFLYVIGDKDPFGWERTLKIWDHIYKASGDMPYIDPVDATNQQKWFLKIPGADHNLAPWGHAEQFYTICSFVKIVCGDLVKREPG